MAEIGVTRPEHIWLVQTPSRAAQGWREAFAATCDAQGWVFALHQRGQATPQPHPAQPQLTVSDYYADEGTPISHWFIQRGVPDEAPDVLVEHGLAPADAALYEASLSLAMVEHMVQAGARVLTTDQDIVVLPGLGEIYRPDGVSEKALNPHHPLGFYGSTPLTSGASVRWGPENFNYIDAKDTDGEGRISLIGRRRLLFNGPPIFLPPARWRFEGEFSINPPGETELLIEWGHGYDVQPLSVAITRPGRYSVSLEKGWSVVACADFRISLMIPALDGELEFHGGVLTRIGDAPTPDPVPVDMSQVESA